MTDELSLEVHRTIRAPREALFDAWLDPSRLAQFMKPGEDMGTPRIEIDAREGGAFFIGMRAGEAELPHRGVYKTIRRPEELAFTWESDFAGPGSIVTIRFEDLGDEGTRVTLRHVGFPNEERRQGHEAGWTRILSLAEESARDE